MSKIYVGFTTTPLIGVEHFIPEPQAPGNYKDPAKIADYVAKAKESAIANARDSRMFGYLNDVAIAGKDGAGYPAILTLWDYLNASDTIVGINVFSFLHFLVKKSVDANHTISPSQRWAIRTSGLRIPIFECKKLIYDPLEILGGSEASAHPAVFARIWNINKIWNRRGKEA